MHHATFTESFRRIRAHVAAAELPVTEHVTRVGVPGLRRLAAHAPDARLSRGLAIAGAGRRPRCATQNLAARRTAPRRAPPAGPGPARSAGSLPPGCRVL